jgi:hypothetical protein
MRERAVTIDPSVSRYVIIGVAVLGVAILAAVVFTPAGCGVSGGPSDYDRMVQAEQASAGTLAAAGAKTQKKSYPVGTGWVVDMTGVTVTDDLLRQLKQLGSIAELDLKKSTVTDAHLALMNELGLHVLLFKLDLSHTAVTDAGLEKLNGNVFLGELNLTGTKVTPAGIDRFKKSRQADPKVRIKNTNVRR